MKIEQKVKLNQKTYVTHQSNIQTKEMDVVGTCSFSQGWCGCYCCKRGHLALLI